MPIFILLEFWFLTDISLYVQCSNFGELHADAADVSFQMDREQSQLNGVCLEMRASHWFIKSKLPAPSPPLLHRLSSGVAPSLVLASGHMPSWDFTGEGHGWVDRFPLQSKTEDLYVPPPEQWKGMDLILGMLISRQNFGVLPIIDSNS